MPVASPPSWSPPAPPPEHATRNETDPYRTLSCGEEGSWHTGITAMSYLLAFLGFATLIILHEAGHFVAAKAVGMRVERFSLFFGPLLWKVRRGETEYGIGPIPLGGYVRITGMNPHEDIPPEVVGRAYYNQPVWKRIVVILAGPFVNLVIAFVIIWALILSNGQQGPVINKIAAVQTNTAAATALRPGDRILSVDGVGGSPDALRKQLGTHRCAGQQVNGCLAATPATIVVRRDGTLLTFHLRPRYSAVDKRPLVGFQFDNSRVSVGPVHAASLTISGMWRVTTQTVGVIARIFEPQERKQLNGVVGGYTVTQESFATSTTLALQVLALISLSLAVINLFPFLPLDGGHVFWALAEKIRGRKIPFDVMERAGVVGFVLILLLFVIGLSNDISTLTGKGFNVR
jgi:regulator of sigma E protease